MTRRTFNFALFYLIGILILAPGTRAQVSTVAHPHGPTDADNTLNWCVAVPTSDQLTSSGAFATTCALPSGLPAGTVIEVRFHGYFSTSSAGTLALQVDAGGTAGICPASSNFNLAASMTNGYFDGECKIIIASTGTSGSADAYGWYEKAAIFIRGGKFIAISVSNKWVFGQGWILGTKISINVPD